MQFELRHASSWLQNLPGTLPITEMSILFSTKNISGDAHAARAFTCLTDYYYTSFGSAVNIHAIDMS